MTWAIVSLRLRNRVDGASQLMLPTWTSIKILVPFVPFVFFVRNPHCNPKQFNYEEGFSQSSPRAPRSQPDAALVDICDATPNRLIIKHLFDCL
jgi:hypothetical protein